jgi:cytoskeletal protein RodZ
MEQENVALIESIGLYLKSLRQQKKITLQQVNEQIRISVRLLEEIENDIFANLGGLGYAKAMVLSYARFLEADEKKILQLFNEKFHHKPAKISSVKREPRKILLPQNILGIILLIFLIAALTYLTIYLFKHDVISWSAFQKIEKPADSKQNIFIPDTISILQKIRLEPTRQENIVIKETALRDTTDYLKSLLFQDKKSPLAYQEK